MSRLFIKLLRYYREIRVYLYKRFVYVVGFIHGLFLRPKIIDAYQGVDGLIVITRLYVMKGVYATLVYCRGFKTATIIPVQMYSTKNEAIIGHTEWVRTMNTAPRPKELYNVFTKEVISIT